ncbi:universal stress protein [Lujinxingia sediminis]|uniref:Universal stress protein n=1 Tax=Lujinxingia sediminis TaxID=2480984 RepID=A0ABY0CW21_9DELT|nr:universal stress protein [Lujinxingia sediminis]RVU48062.1 universal stress protein [Lujinxingia sediminis]
MQGKRVVIGTDLSENAQPAARYALKLGRLLGLEVHVLHVLDVSLKSWKSAFEEVSGAQLRDKLDARIRDWFEEATGEAPDGVMLEVGSPMRSTCEMCQKGDVAFLVIGMSGRGAWNKFIFGSTAMELAHTPPCPLIIVHPERDRVEAGMEIALGTDFSERSDRAMEVGVALVNKLKSPMHLVHAHALSATTVILDSELPEALQSTAIVDWAEEAMASFMKRHDALLEGVDCDAHLLSQSPVAGLRDFVESANIDLVVVGHYPADAGRLDRLASVMVKWVQNMNCTTLIVPAPGAIAAR